MGLASIRSSSAATFGSVFWKALLLSPVKITPSSVLTLLRATYAWPCAKIDDPRSIAALSRLRPWVLCTVTAQARTSGNWYRSNWSLPFLLLNVAVAGWMATQSGWAAFVLPANAANSLVCCPTRGLSNLIRIAEGISVLPVAGHTKSTITPCAPLVRPSWTARFLRSMTLAPFATVMAAAKPPQSSVSFGIWAWLTLSLLTTPPRVTWPCPALRTTWGFSAVVSCSNLSVL